MPNLFFSLTILTSQLNLAQSKNPMIKQIAPIPQKTSNLTGINKGLVQAQLKDHTSDADKPENGILWSPITAGPYLVPILRWIE